MHKREIGIDMGPAASKREKERQTEGTVCEQYINIYIELTANMMSASGFLIKVLLKKERNVFVRKSLCIFRDVNKTFDSFAQSERGKLE